MSPPNLGLSSDLVRRRWQRKRWADKQLDQGMCRDCKRPRKMGRHGRLALLCAYHIERHSTVRRLKRECEKKGLIGATCNDS